MKFKMILMGYMIGSVLLTQTACTKVSDVNNSISKDGDNVLDESNIEDTTDLPVNSDEVNNEEKEADIENTRIMDEFNTLLSGTDVKLLGVITFIQNNIKDVSVDNATVMLLNFEELQKKDLALLEVKYYSETVQISFQEANQNGDDFNKINELSDVTLQQLLQETKDNGYKLEQAEGFYFPVVDYFVYQQFTAYVTPDMKEYISIMTVESNQAFAKDAALVIGWKEVINRALSVEAFLNNYSESVKADAIKELYQRYEAIMLFGLNNTPLFDYETNTLKEEAKSAYEEILTNNLESNILIKLKGFMDIVKTNDYQLTDEVEQYRKEISSKVTTSNETTSNETTSNETTSNESNKTTNEIVKTDENRYYVAGIDNATEFEDTFRILQELVNKENKKVVAEYIAYPITVTIDGTRTEIADEIKFIEQYDNIMTDVVKKAFINQKVEDTFVNYKGVMVGQGELWFNKLEGTKHTYSIYGINN